MLMLHVDATTEACHNPESMLPKLFISYQRGTMTFSIEGFMESAQHDVVLVPLVAFDETGQRLGQGGGFYDRAIAAAGASRPLLIGVAHAFQQVRSVPVEAWDMPLDAVVTEERVHEFRVGCLSL